MGYYQKTNRKRKILGYKQKHKPNQRCQARRITEVFSNSSLENKRCFLIAGGPSLINFDYTLLKDEFTIGVNKTFLDYHPTMIYCMDIALYEYLSRLGRKRAQKEAHLAWLAYKGYKVFLCPKRKHTFTDDIYVVDRLLGKTLSLDISKSFYPGKNSGFGALTLAIAMGAREIYLLGYDLKTGPKERTHCHDGYPNQDFRKFVKRLEKFRVEFEEFAPIIEKEGIKVVNLSKNSALECFSKDSIENILKS